jgi:hypothetical protein
VIGSTFTFVEVGGNGAAATIGSTSLVLWIAQEGSRRPQWSFSRTANRKRAFVCQRRLMPERSGVGDGRRPAPVQVDHGGRRGPFSGL